MNEAFARRLLVLSTVALAGIFAVLVAAASLLVFSVYVGSLNRLLAETLDDVQSYVVERGTPAKAPRFAGELAERFFRPELNMYALDATSRVVVSRQKRAGAGRPPARIRIYPRSSVVGAHGPHDPLGRLAVALATSFGLAPVRAQFGTLSFYIRANDFVLVETVRHVLPSVILAELVAVAGGFGLARFLTGEALKPLTEVTSALERFAAGDLTPQVIPADKRGRLGALAQAYNGAIVQMQAAFAERAQAHAAMRQFIADAGHQLRTPLTVIRGFIAVLRNNDVPNVPDYRRVLDTMHAQSLVMASLISKLILLERWERNAAACEPIDVAQLVEDVVAPIAEAHAERTIRVDVETAACAGIDPSNLAHAVTNLVDNALKYTSGEIRVVCFSVDGGVAVEVADDGPGMSPDELRHAFDRFYRGATRRDVEGSGLGLAIAKRAVEVAGGTIAVASSPERGSRFTILLPVVAVRPRPAARTLQEA